MKKILIALDNNADAKKVAETGYALSEALHAHTTLMHVTPGSAFYASLNYSPIAGFDSFSNLDIVQAGSVEELKITAEKYLDNVKLSLGDETIETVVKEGGYAENILQTAKEMKADMIVMGTHSRKGLDKVLLGSVAENVLHHTTIPLFIIPVKSPEEK
ncbi:universal stress protein [Ginsengibacter hankyongi]|uniref:Universal stress protein n=1 Tax=Ginsengibacter hankyongi TaxID=2607284 RepID=A0A5J5IHI7_9BACT|nr:universal stress protein [Ginsengibacter hankyongi]KAA9040525.1 universal stress protein [Ginsengibacter hankyongi]